MLRQVSCLAMLAVHALPVKHPCVSDVAITSFWLRSLPVRHHPLVVLADLSKVSLVNVAKFTLLTQDPIKAASYFY